MISNILLSLLATPGMTLPTPPSSPAPVANTTISTALDTAADIAAAGEDVAKLLELADAWKKDGKNSEAKLAFARVLELDDSNEKAHKGLRHQFYDNQWFKSYSAMSKYRRAEAKRMASEGFSKLNDEWVKTDDLPYLRMGWAKDEAGNWADPSVLEQAKLEAKMIADGFKMRNEDSSWVHPDDFPKWEAGQWKCGDDWVSVEEANAYHSTRDQWWNYRSTNFTVLATCDYETTRWAAWYAEQTYKDLVKIFGLKPKGRPEVVVFPNIEQFNAFAAGSPQKQQPAEASGFSSLHYAYFADAWYDMASQTPRFKGTGVAYWDTKNEAMSPFGKHSIRHAAGLAYAEAITPSVKTISAAIAAQDAPELTDFWAEKAVPRWLFYGGASYVDRYFVDSTADNKYWAREWSLSNVLSSGKVDPLPKIFAFELSLEAIDASTRLITEAGLVVSFIMDGACAPVIAKHRAYKAALRKGNEEAAVAIKVLQDEILANQAAFNKYVNGQ
jgi:hypothetical protein